MINSWYLEGYLESNKYLTRLVVDESPFVIGRSTTVSLTINMAGISRQHLELSLEDDRLYVKDLGSVNGTFVNDKAILGRVVLYDGDILTIAQQEFRLSCQNFGLNSPVSEVTSIITSVISEKLVRGTKQLRELMENKQLTAHFQPIVTNEGLLGYEALARGSHESLSSSPLALFTIAESIGLEVELSELCREQALAIADRTNKGVPYFFNIHPAEFKGSARLMESVAKLRNQYPDLELVFEVHEEAVTDITQMAELSEQLHAQGIKLAYDDFGAGQTRLMELTEVPADYVKFDIQLIRDIHKAPEPRQQMVAMLIKFAQQAGSLALAEGVETEEEATKCRELGFDLYQGYYFGRPQAHI